MQVLVCIIFQSSTLIDVAVFTDSDVDVVADSDIDVVADADIDIVADTDAGPLPSLGMVQQTLVQQIIGELNQSASSAPTLSPRAIRLQPISQSEKGATHLTIRKKSLFRHARVSST